MARNIEIESGLKLMAIDPGYTKSAWVSFSAGQIVAGAIRENEKLLPFFADAGADGGYLAIEDIQSYGMAVGREVFDTCVWIGRFIQAWGGSSDHWDRVPRREAKLRLCGNSRAKDANIRQALLDLYGPGKDKAVGLKHSKGPLYEIKTHLWSALAIGVTWHMQRDHAIDTQRRESVGSGTTASQV